MVNYCVFSITENLEFKGVDCVLFIDIDGVNSLSVAACLELYKVKNITLQLFDCIAFVSSLDDKNNKNQLFVLEESIFKEHYFNMYTHYGTVTTSDNGFHTFEPVSTHSYWLSRVT